MLRNRKGVFTVHKLRKAIIIFLIVLVLPVFIYLNILRQNYVVPILMYHSISPEAQDSNALSVTLETFQKQMKYLKDHNYNVIPLESLVCQIKEKKKIPPKTLVITFDDGYRDNYLYAFSILKKYELPATFFIIVKEVGRPQGDRLSWEELRQMSGYSFISIGSHCLGPEPLINIKSDALIKKEIYDSKKILEEKLEREISLFSYPEGFFNDKIRKMVIDAGYKGAVTTNPGRNYSDKDVFALKRLRISENAKNLFVFWVETSGYYTFMKESKRKK